MKEGREPREGRAAQGGIPLPPGYIVLQADCGLREGLEPLGCSQWGILAQGSVIRLDESGTALCSLGKLFVSSAVFSSFLKSGRINCRVVLKAA